MTSNQDNNFEQVLDEINTVNTTTIIRDGKAESNFRMKPLDDDVKDKILSAHQSSLEEAEKRYYKAVLSNWAKNHPNMTVSELYKGQFEQKTSYRAATLNKEQEQ